MGIPHDQIDPDAEKVVRRLTRGGFTAYLVGGCVRDLLLRRRPKDFDIATSATPPELKSLFRNCRIIGRRFRLAHIFFGSKIIETSTFRANPRELDAEAEAAALETNEGAPVSERELLIRRDNVFGSAEEDARRRDFTINGLFYDLDEDRVIDYVAGLPDLESHTVRTIGDPDIRFREDPVRILRAIKFAARLDFTIEAETYRAILTHKQEIEKCAAPRVLEEIYRLLRGGAARRSVELLEETGVLALLIPELARQISGELRSQIYSILDGLDALVRAGDTPTNALLVCALLAPLLSDVLYDRAGAEPFRGDVGLVIDERGRPMLEGMRASRRDTERTRQILMAQRRLAPPPRRRSRPMTLVKRDWFAEALAVFELMHPQAAPEIAEEIARWHRLLHESHSGASRGSGEADPSAPSSASGDEPRRRRRRRRGGRRRRRPGETGEASPLSDSET